MPSIPTYRTELFNRLLEGKLSPGDTEELINWLGSDTIDPEAAALILLQVEQTVPSEKVTPELIAALEARLPAVLAGKPGKAPVHMLPSKWLRYAAAILLLLSAGAYFLFNRKTATEIVTTTPAPAVQEIQPGKDGAILTLADGTKVVLDSLGNGVVAAQNGTQVVLNNGQLVYNADGSTAAAEYNILVTPKGRQFRIILPDGTKVWLNAASSIRYPTVFAGNERRVKVMGEAYFEVAAVRNTAGNKMPFNVEINTPDQLNGAEVEVLGTHFNINAYQNEAGINTTLLEGSVRVTGNGNSAVLNPGQQAQLSYTRSPIKVLDDVNIKKVMAWKDGIFDFQDATLEEVMRQLERWYNIEVVYEKGIPDLEFFGKMGRDLTLENVLRGLEASNVHCRLEGRRLVVLP